LTGKLISFTAAPQQNESSHFQQDTRALEPDARYMT
jgi:hypothetical protein